MSNPYRKGMDSTSLRESINAHCYMCNGGDISDVNTRRGVTNLISECTSEVCPLWNVRPYQKKNAVEASGQGGAK